MSGGSSCAVVDYRMGNLHSAAKALQQVAPDARITITSEPAEIKQAERVLLPGVGAIGDCMAAFSAAALDEAVRESVAAGRPLLAICIGMQMLLERSEENSGVAGLGMLPGEVRHFGAEARDEDGRKLKVPHMGWNEVWQSAPHPLWADIADGSRFYFVHGYRADAGIGMVGESHYGGPFAAAMAGPGIFAVQFHPEKSHSAGLRLLANFMSWDGSA